MSIRLERTRTKLSKESKKRFEKATKAKLSIISSPVSFKDLPWIFKVGETSGVRYEVLVDIQPSCSCLDFQKHQKSTSFEVIICNTVFQKRTETFLLKMFRTALQAPI